MLRFADRARYHAPLSSSALSANGPRCSLTRTQQGRRDRRRHPDVRRGRDSADAWSEPEMFSLGKDGMPYEIAGVPPDCFSATGTGLGNPHLQLGIIRAKTDTYGGLPACAARSSCTTACASTTSWASITILRFPQEAPEPMAPGCRDRASSCSSVHSRNRTATAYRRGPGHSHSRCARPACKLRFFRNGRSGVRGLRHPRANLAAQ